MSASDIDDYLAGLEEPKRRTLEELRASIRATVPDAEECLSYGMPAFRLHGAIVAGFAAFTSHLSYLPHSGSVLPRLAGDLASYRQTKSALHFGVGEPLPAALVAKLLATRLEEIDHR